MFDVSTRHGAVSDVRFGHLVINLQAVLVQSYFPCMDYWSSWGELMLESELRRIMGGF